MSVNTELPFNAHSNARQYCAAIHAQTHLKKHLAYLRCGDHCALAVELRQTLLNLIGGHAQVDVLGSEIVRGHHNATNVLGCVFRLCARKCEVFYLGR